MVGIQRLNDLTVDADQNLWIDGVPDALAAGTKPDADVVLCIFGRDGKICAETVPCVMLAPVATAGKRMPDTGFLPSLVLLRTQKHPILNHPLLQALEKLIGSWQNKIQCCAERHKKNLRMFFKKSVGYQMSVSKPKDTNA